MALIFTDGFDSYAATSDLTKKWSSVSGGWTWSSSAGKTGGGGLTCAAGSAGGILATPATLFGGATTGYCHLGFYVKLSAAPSGTVNFIRYVTLAGINPNDAIHAN
jgi:hypothetical protein